MKEEPTQKLTLLSRASAEAVDFSGAALQTNAGKRLSVEHCQKILNSSGRPRLYSLTEAEQVRDALYRIAHIHLLHIEEASSHEEGDSVYPRQYRRAS